MRLIIRPDESALRMTQWRCCRPTEELILTIDGQEHERLVPGEKVVARRAEQPVRLVRFPGQTFF